MTHRADILMTAAALFLGTALTVAPAVASTVVTDVGACSDYYVLFAPNGYALVQWSAGKILARGDVLVADITGTGQRDTTLTTGQRVRIFVEDAGMSQGAATQTMNMRCGVKPTGLFHVP